MEVKEKIEEIPFDVEKEELLARLLEKEGIEIPQATVIKRIPREGPLPLSFAQERLWFLDQLEPNSPTYNLSSALRLTGRLTVVVLEQVLTEILRRHEVLRTTFTNQEGKSIQVIHPSSPFRFARVELSNLAKNEREGEILRLATDEAERPFDLSQGPLIRASLINLGPEEHVILFTMHHIISDGWSLGILIREVVVLYEAYAAGKSSPLPELSIQYADFAKWQREWLKEDVLGKQLSYWKEKLQGVPELLELPTDRPRPPVGTSHGAIYFFSLPVSLSQSLRELSQKEGTTLFMTLLAAFQLLLSRYSGQEDICVGTPHANRNRAEIENLIGFFVNTLVLRTDLTGNPSFRELLHRVRDVCLGAYAHQDLPFEKLVEEINPVRSLAHSPLFQVLFALQNAPMNELTIPGLTLTPLKEESETALFSITLEIEETKDGLNSLIEYNTDLFDRSSIARMAGHFERLLQGIVECPNQRISEIPLLTENELQRTVFEWNQTQKDYPQDLCIQQLFEEQVTKTADRIAVISEGRQLTYQELNSEANQLAHYLKKLGVSTESMVGLCIDRSPEMITGLLGILKAGGTYIPLDPKYPKHRLALLLGENDFFCVVTREKFKNRFTEYGLPLVLLDADREMVSKEGSENPACPVSPENLAYIIFTSGSTGIPKGVLLQHHSLVNNMRALVDEYVITPADRMLQFSSFSWDTSLEEIFPTLISGATLVLRSDDMIATIQQFLEECDRTKVTLFNLPTAFWQELVSTLFKEKLKLPSCIRLMIMGGERGTPEKVALWKEYVGAYPKLIHNFGITEATAVTTLCDLSSLPNIKDGYAVPIGRPIANVKTYILDSSVNPVPIGVPGELCIGGISLARGYLDQPGLTQAKFVPNPFSRDSGDRLFRTGDLVRYREDGNIECLGRIDQQVKIRGFRIEPGEIEMVFNEHPLIKESVVIAREDKPGDRRLVAYLVLNKKPSGEEEVTIRKLREGLKEKLPDFMMPSIFVILDKLPRNSSGKIERMSLPAPDRTRLELVASYLAPRNPVEEKIAEFFSDVLGVERVGVNDNFFELGGHSLLATQLFSRIRNAFQKELPLRVLFERPTIAGLADAINTEVAQSPLLTPILPLSRESHRAQLSSEGRLEYSK